MERLKIDIKICSLYKNRLLEFNALWLANEIGVKSIISTAQVEDLVKILS